MGPALGILIGGLLGVFYSDGGSSSSSSAGAACCGVFRGARGWQGKNVAAREDASEAPSSADSERAAPRGSPRSAFSGMITGTS